MQSKLIALAIAAGAVVAAPAAAQHDFDWSGTLRAGQTIEVRGVNGPVRVLPATGNAVRVQATRTARRSDPESVRIEVVEHVGGVTVCAVYPTPWGERRRNECRPGGGQTNTRDNDVQVAFDVMVPAGIALRAATVNGDVRVEDVRSDVRASTVNGNVNVTTTGLVRATTVNGNVLVRMGSDRLPEGTRFATVNGNVTVEMPGGVDAELRATTVSGRIDSDFPVAIRGRISPRTVRGTLGAGGPQLTMATVNGSIRLRRI